MKKVLIVVSLILFYVSSLVAVGYYYSHRYDYPKSKTTMTVDEFLHDKNSNHWKELYFDGEKNVAYRNMVIIRDDDHIPLRNDTARNTIEIKIVMAAGGTAEPRKGCDPSDPMNGIFGCYMDFPEN